MKIDLEKMLDENIIFMTARQLCFGRYIKSYDFNIDVEEGLIDFDGVFGFKAQLLGSESYASNTWLWGWANSSTETFKSNDMAKRLKALGEEKGIEIFTLPQFELNNFYNGYNLSILCAKIAKADVMYSCDTGGEGRAFFLLYKEGSDEFKTDVTAQDILAAFEQLYVNTPFHHLTAIRAALQRANLDLVIQDNQINLGEATISFDAHGRCSEIKKIMRPQARTRRRRYRRPR